MRTSSTCLPSDFEPKGYETKTSTRVYRTITCSLRRALTLDDFRNSFAPDVGVIHTQPSSARPLQVQLSSQLFAGSRPAYWKRNSSLPTASWARRAHEDVKHMLTK